MKNIFLVSFTILFCLGCSGDFLNTAPKGTWHEGNFDMNSSQELQALSLLTEGYNSFREQTWPITAMHCHTSDNSHPGGPAGDGGVDFAQFPALSFTPSNSHFTTYWTTHYNAITKANQALAMLSGMEETEEVLQMKAEAYFIRAAAYFRLTQAFGAVSYVDRVMDIEEEVADQLPASEIRSRYAKDLVWAIPYLPTRAEMVSSGNLGRATQNAARAILAKTYMYEKDWANCLVYTEQIIESGDNNLSTPYAEMFYEQYEFGPESVWEINADYKPNLSIDMMCQWNMMCGVRGEPNLGWGHNAPSEDLMADYEEGDPRYDATVLRAGQTLNGETIVASDYEYFNKKAYIPPTERKLYGRDDWCYGYWTNMRIIRYADILLMHAEAACELGHLEDAIDKLEMVRARARGGNNTVLPKISTADQDELRGKIRHERRIELALEYERYFDLVRWGIAKEKLENFVEGKHELFPIPQAEVDRAKGKLVQNPGY